MDLVVVGACRQQSTGLGEYCAILLEEVVQERLPGIISDGAEAWLLDVILRGAHPLLEDAAIAPPEPHAEVLEVPQDGPQGPEVVNT